MSERPKPSNPSSDFDPLAESRKRSDIGYQIYQQFMERDAEPGLSPEDHAKGHKEFADYLEGRPDGSSESTEQSGEAVEEDLYKKMSLVQLARESAKAELRGDKTTQSSIDEAILERVDAMDLSDSTVSSDGTPRKSEKELMLERLIRRRQKTIDRVTRYREKSNNKPEGDENDPNSSPMDTNKDPNNDSDFYKDVMDSTNRIIGIDNNKDWTNDGGEYNIEEPPVPPGPEEPPEPEEPEEPEKEKEGVDANKYLDKKTIEKLVRKRSKYAELSAKRRGETLFKSKEELESAKLEYEATVKAANQEAYERMIEDGISPEEARNAILASTIEESKLLMEQIQEERIAISSGKTLRKFYQWFGRQKGFMGKVKKVAAITAVTAPLGVVAGAAGVALLGPAIGAVAGGLLARGITRGLAAAKINREAGAENLSQVEAREDIKEAAQKLKQWMEQNPGETPPPFMITEVAERTTRERLSENRRRTAKVVALSALIAGIAAGAHWLLTHGGETHVIDTADPGKPEVHDAFQNTPNEIIATPTSPPGSFTGIQILDGKPFLSDVGHAGLVPKGMEQDLVDFLRQKGLDNGVDITGFKNGRMFHTIDGYSRISDTAKKAILEFRRMNNVPTPKNFWDKFLRTP